MSEATERTCGDHADRLLRKANVVGVAGGDEQVVVFVTKKQPLSALAADDVVDPEVDGIETDVISVGRVEAKLASGDSIGKDTTGTAGGVVVDENGLRYVLTNNHVAANSNKAAMLSLIHSPGPHDGLGGVIGKLARYEPIYLDSPNLIDAALVRLDEGVEASNHYESSTTTARTGWEVQKYGRTTGHNTGQVIGRNATIEVWFGDRTVRFVDQLVTDYMLDGGDSGSVLLSRSGHPIGLCFAGSDKISLHNPINLVLRTLAVRFV